MSAVWKWLDEGFWWKPLAFPGTRTIVVKVTRTMRWAQKKKCIPNKGTKERRTKRSAKGERTLKVLTWNFVYKIDTPQQLYQRAWPGVTPANSADGSPRWRKSKRTRDSCRWGVYVFFWESTVPWFLLSPRHLPEPNKIKKHQSEDISTYKKMCVWVRVCVHIHTFQKLQVNIPRCRACCLHQNAF